MMRFDSVILSSIESPISHARTIAIFGCSLAATIMACPICPLAPTSAIRTCRLISRSSHLHLSLRKRRTTPVADEGYASRFCFELFERFAQPHLVRLCHFAQGQPHFARHHPSPAEGGFDRHRIWLDEQIFQ